MPTTNWQVHESLTFLQAARIGLDLSPTLLVVFYVTLLLAQLWDPNLDLDVAFKVCRLLLHGMAAFVLFGWMPQRCTALIK
ncbi:hypothetical protein PC121_g11721 [Phytophthora cactorum]|nr:hypothetical protein PC121_g11721 [Phytophthora cactorum]KAG4054993.1 hypothetical protein PC123_g9896 [Phytophthora cactorum]